MGTNKQLLQRIHINILLLVKLYILFTFLFSPNAFQDFGHFKSHIIRDFLKHDKTFWIIIVIFHESITPLFCFL